MKNKVSVEIVVNEVCPKTDGNFAYVKLYGKETMCETKNQVLSDLSKLNKEATELIQERVKK